MTEYKNIDDLMDLATELNQEEIQTMMDVRTVYRKRKMQPVDVEERLRRFHEAHDNEKEKETHDNEKGKGAALRTYIYYALAAAAVFIGALLLLHKPAIDTQTEGTVFVADHEQSGISLTNEQGEQVMLSKATKQNSSISLEDFRKVFSKEENMERVTLNVPFGKSTDITLPDGSIVYLHPGSKLAFPTSFEGDKRVVMLDGEAYFKVTKDATRPFVVMTDETETTVLGTEFNVKTGTGAWTEITLITGSVALRLNHRKPIIAGEDGQEMIILKPGQQAVHDAQNVDLRINQVDVQPYEFWRDGYLYYDNVELKDIMEAIGKNFNMTVEFRNNEAMHYKMRFITERNNGIEAALDMMNRMKKVSVRKQGNKIIVE